MAPIGSKSWKLPVVALLASAIAGGLLTSVLVNGPAVSATPASSDPGLALQADFVRVVHAVRSSVVEISTASGLGSGVVYDSKGDIVTNAHVVGSDTKFTVSLSNGQTLQAHLVGIYTPDDLAVIRVTSKKALVAARLGNSAALEVGDIVLAMGNPLGLSSSVTEGIVSFNGRGVSEGNGVFLPDLVQTSAAINPGNSGGALVNLSGQVVGIPTLGASTGSAAAPGLGFAIPSNTVSLIAPQLISKGKVTTAGRAALGLSANTAYSLAGAPIGIVVTGVQANSPAAKAGIVPGELITGVNGSAITAVTDLQSILARLWPGDRVTVSLTKPSGEKSSLPAVLADLAQL
jgi:S1-C subfamily serine protease